MRVQNIINPNINNLLKNKLFLKSLEKVAEHGTSFSAGISLAMALSIRPLAIMKTPKAEEENKQYACASSIASGLIKFGIVEAVALPIENAVKKIDKTPEKYLKQSTILNLATNSETLAKSKSYKLATQILKLGTGFVTAIPKSILTIALIPFIMDNLFKFSSKDVQKNEKRSNNLTFTGKITDKLPSKLGAIINTNTLQRFVKRHQNQEQNIAKHITAGTDTLLAASFAFQTSKSKHIKENRKKALIYNNLISTGITIASGYMLDKVIKCKTTNFIKKFSQINKLDPKLHKYIEGINIIRPTLIFAGIYYGILPIFSTYTAEIADKIFQKK